MKIGELAEAAGVSVDTVRYYERQKLLDAPPRSPSRYRVYSQIHLEHLRFVRSAQSLGFSLTQIAAIMPRLRAGEFGRAEIEQQLREKMLEIDQQIQRLETMRHELQTAFGALSCAPAAPVSPGAATLAAPSAPVRIRKLHAKI
jgi:DNA-binding transcriptional MerR regulator